MTALATVLATGAFFLVPGDRVVFYGDSITEHQRIAAYVEAFVRCRMPGLKVRFSSAGWAGDTVEGASSQWAESGGTADERVDRDVAPRKPTVVASMLGMNDGGYYPLRADWLEKFERGYARLVRRIQAIPSKPRVVLLSPTPWDDFTRPPSYPQNVPNSGGGYSDTLAAYRDAVRDLSARLGCSYIDLFGTMADGLRAAAKADPQLATTLISDWVHPDGSGALIPAVEILAAWGAPALVSDVRLDARPAKVVSADGARIREWDGRTWLQRDDGLPFPFDPADPSTALAARSCRLAQRLDAHRLAVAGLAPGRHALEIDGVRVGAFDAAEWSVGIDLGTLPTPMRRDALEVLAAVKEKNQAQFVAWREVERKFGGRYRAASAAAAGLGRLEAEIEGRIRGLAAPRWRRYSLRSVDPSAK